MKNIIRIRKILIALIILIITFTLLSNTYATTVSNNVENWVLTINSTETGLKNLITSIAGGIIWFIRKVTIVLSIIMIIIIGIKYMNGSIEEKATNKKMLINIVIGAVVMMSVTGIVGTIFDNIYRE